MEHLQKSHSIDGLFDEIKMIIEKYALDMLFFDEEQHKSLMNES